MMGALDRSDVRMIGWLALKVAVAGFFCGLGAAALLGRIVP